MKNINIYSSGLCYCSVCAPADMPKEVIEIQANLFNPTGIKNRWKISDNPTFGDGTLNGHEQTCDGVSTRHWLLAC